MSMTKTIQFTEFLESLRPEPDAHRVVSVEDETHAWLTQVHAWLMDNLNYPEEKQIFGMLPARTYFGASAHNREAFTVRRYATFIHGAIVRENKLYEFLPGAVYIYDLPGSHLINFTFPTLHPALPDSIHAHYGVPRPTTVYRQYLGKGWVLADRTNGGTWHGRYNVDMIPGINGGALRNIFTDITRRIGISAKAIERPTKDFWKGTKPEWFAMLQRNCLLPEDISIMRDYRDGRRSFDPTHPALQELHQKLVTLESAEVKHPTEVKASFEKLFAPAMAAMISSVESKE